MARLILLIPVLIFVGAKLVTWYANRRTAELNRRIADARAGTAHLDPTAFGLPARTELDATRNTAPDASDEAAARAAAAAGSGDWRPFAAHLAEAGDDHELRHVRIRGLAEHAAEEDGWLRAWRAERPDSPDAAIVHATALVELAWKVRSSLRASEVSREQFAAFHRILAEAEEAFDRAAELAPGDPAPWAERIPVAMGLGWDHERFGQLWQEVVRRSPHLFTAHLNALQYWCAKWRGSHELMTDFAERAAAAAPPESLLAGLPLLAVHEREITQDTYAAWRTPAARAAADRLLAALETVPADDRRVPKMRHLLAYALTFDERYAEAVGQFRLAGRYIGCQPWSYSGDPVARFSEVRNRALVGWEKAGRPAPTAAGVRGGTVGAA
ncbi:DUF4034 domain-containing protein [Streptomyces sp. NRRL B-24484]|uniref:DUF4034 domain-containing protein n=1 Tax=Streptomyces sp. NRRL B-24484 TaxID=1463833 RepID=UPI0006933439|nr:DUF4034 domain-containing protein [Streptomyces sp. NRRL B-24484]